MLTTPMFQSPQDGDRPCRSSDVRSPLRSPVSIPSRRGQALQVQGLKV